MIDKGYDYCEAVSDRKDTIIISIRIMEDAGIFKEE
jgi:hypothetical protein